MKKIILASSSPRRKELLKNIGLNFNVVSSDYMEDMTLDMKPTELAKYLSLGKAQDVAKNHINTIIIAADTFVVLNDDLLGKPHTEEKAFEMLQKINGQTLEVITGYTIIDTSMKYSISKAVTTKIFIKKLTDDEIKSYIKTGEPLDKAGAFAIQGYGSIFIKEIQGSYTNVIGLPIYSLAESLKKFGVSVL
ncbi:MAG: Maf family protein [Candidatus Moraniibacteriota bacterium]